MSEANSVIRDLDFLCTRSRAWGDLTVLVRDDERAEVWKEQYPDLDIRGPIADVREFIARDNQICVEILEVMRLVKAAVDEERQTKGGK